MTSKPLVDSGGFFYEPKMRFELTAYPLRGDCSTTELLRQQY